MIRINHVQQIREQGEGYCHPTIAPLSYFSGSGGISLDGETVGAHLPDVFPGFPQSPFGPNYAAKRRAVFFKPSSSSLAANPAVPSKARLG